MELLEQIKENAKKQCKTIVLPEGTEERTIQAADQIIGCLLYTSPSPRDCS